MRVVVPALDGRLHPKAERALALYARDAEIVDVSGENGYWCLLSKMWDEGESFAVVEHDVEIHEDVVRSFAECPEPDCSFGYRMRGGEHETFHGLGCVRFSAGLIKAEPDLLDVNNRDWRNLDGEVRGQLFRRGYKWPHEHRPEVFHHHWRPQTGICDCADPDCARVPGFDKEEWLIDMAARSPFVARAVGTVATPSKEGAG